MPPKTWGQSGLTGPQIERYSRQCLLPDFRPSGTAALIRSRVLIVGAGGLGSSAAMYLAAAGIGFIRIADHDRVERSNLHRQVIHPDSRCGEYKAESAKKTLNDLNPLIEVEAVIESFRVDSAAQLMQGVDVVVDATDNVASRYLINDACVCFGVPLVSGSAMRWEGQLTVYNYRASAATSSNSNGDSKSTSNNNNNTAAAVAAASSPTAATATSGSATSTVGSACYRCMFPKPPPAATVGSCSDSGVVGALPGTIGCLQALETQKVLMHAGDIMAGRMLHFNGLNGTYRVMKMRPRQANCAVCGDQPTITKENTFHAKSTAEGPFKEYVVTNCNIVKKIAGEVSVRDFYDLLRNSSCSDMDGLRLPREEGEDEDKKRPWLLLDARDPVQHELVGFDSSNAPYTALQAHWDAVKAAASNPASSKQVQGEGAAKEKVENSERLPMPQSGALKRLQEILQKALVLAKDSSAPSPLRKRARESEAEAKEEHEKGESESSTSEAPPLPVYIFCRRGIYSGQTVELLTELRSRLDLPELDRILPVNIAGGLAAFTAKVEEDFPSY